VKTFLTLIVGVFIGIAAFWFFSRNTTKPGWRSARDQIESSAKSARDTLQEKLRSLKLRAGDITNELARTGRVIREKAQQAGQAISNATADARVTAAIKAKLLRDPDLSAWDISVNTTGGVVTLSGTASSPENIGKAMLLALETDGVKQVISTLQVKPAGSNAK